MKKTLKHLMMGLLSVVMVLAGLAPFGQMAHAQEPIKLTFWHGMGGSTGEALQKLVDQFNDSQDEIVVEAQYQGSYDETLTKLRSSASGSEVGADVVQVFEQGLQFMTDSGLTTPIQDYVDADNFDLSEFEPNLLAYYTINDSLQSMPFNSSTPIMYYNKDIFDKAGITEVPTNMREIFEIAPTLVEKGGATMAMSTTIYGWYIEQWMNKGAFDIFDNGNGRDQAASKVAFDENGGMAKILQMWKDGVDSGAMPNVGREGGSPEFVAGQSAITIGSTASLRQILTEVDNRFEVGTAYYPGVDEEDQDGVSIGGASLYIIDSGDQARQDAAWKFIQFLVSAPSQAQWNADTGYFPVTTAAHEEETFKKNLEEFPQFQTAIDQLHDATPESQGAVSAVNQEARQIFEAELENLLNGNKDVQTAVADMASQVNKALEDYNAANN